MVNLIIGKDSNLSTALALNIENCKLMSSRELLKNINILKDYKSKKINIIFNNFQPATKLNILENSEEYINNSIVLTCKVLEYFKNEDINKVIYTSSSSVYGNNILCSESDELKPMNLHSSLKVSNEKLIEKFCVEQSIDFSIARVFNMYGGNDKFSIISKIIKANKEDKELTIVNNGNAIRDFIHVEDVVKVYVKLLKLKNQPIVNIGTGQGSSIKNILDFLHNQNIAIQISNIYKDELKISTANIKLLLDVMGEMDFIDIESYLKETLNL